MHEEAPAEEYLPAGQDKQSAPAAVLLPVKAQYFPAVQSVQPEAAVTPVLVDHLPAGHKVHEDAVVLDR